MSPARTATRSSQWPPHIRARYGIGPRRRWAPVALALLGLGFAVTVALVGWRNANPTIRAALGSYGVVSDHRMDLELQVVLAEPVAVTCVLRARAPDGFDVGYAVVDLPAGRMAQVVDYPLATAYRGLVGELLGCGTDGLPPGVPGAQFRPGVLPPEQPAR